MPETEDPRTAGFPVTFDAPSTNGDGLRPVPPFAAPGPAPLDAPQSTPPFAAPRAIGGARTPLVAEAIDAIQAIAFASTETTFPGHGRAKMHAYAASEVDDFFRSLRSLLFEIDAVVSDQALANQDLNHRLASGPSSALPLPQAPPLLQPPPAHSASSDTEIAQTMREIYRLRDQTLEQAAADADQIKRSAQEESSRLLSQSRAESENLLEKARNAESEARQKADEIVRSHTAGLEARNAELQAGIDRLESEYAAMQGSVLSFLERSLAHFRSQPTPRTTASAPEPQPAEHSRPEPTLSAAPGSSPDQVPAPRSLSSLADLTLSEQHP